MRSFPGVAAPGLDCSSSSTSAALDDVLAAASARWAAHCLLEAAGGRVTAHHARPGAVPVAVVEAVLSKRIGPLVEDRRRLHTLGLSAGGPVVVGHAPSGTAVVSMPLSRSVDACLWLVMDPATDIDLEELDQVGSRLNRALLDGLDPLALDGASLAECLQTGDAVPARLLGRARALRLLGLRSSSDLTVLEAAVRRCGEPHLGAGRLADALIVLVADDGARAAERLVAAVEAQGLELRSALSMAQDPAAGTGRARDQVLAGLLLAGRGSVVRVEERRSALVLEQLRAPLATSTALVGDPLAALDEVVRRGVDFRGSLLAWFDAHGDVQAAAQQLGVHVNTLRYRVRRAHELLGSDLSDPDERLEIHLRLRLGP